jgi:RHS repeat-associated protein
LAETRNSTNSYYHVDSLGTNVAVTNQDGSLQARYEYDAYGNRLTDAGNSESSFGFTGYQKDEDTGLYYANARYYDSITGTFLREDPLEGNVNTPPSLHRYNYAYSNPTRFIDPDGKYAEDGHYYTTLIAASDPELNFSADEIATLAYYSQLPDEVDDFDAIELVKNRSLSYGLYDDLATERIPGLHALVNEGISEIETNRTSRAIVASKDNFQAVGFLIHRLGDNFSHRKIGDTGNTYQEGVGHLWGFHTPDVIQRRPDLYDNYVQTLVSNLAKVKGGISDDKLQRIMQRVLAKTDRIKNISTTFKVPGVNYDIPGRTDILPVGKSDRMLAKESIAKANEVFDEINKERAAIGKEPINPNFHPEDSGPCLLFCFFDESILDAFEHYNGANGTNTWGLSNQNRFDALNSLNEAMDNLDKTEGLVDLDEAIDANEALIVIEGRDNKTKVKKQE